MGLAGTREDARRRVTGLVRHYPIHCVLTLVQELATKLQWTSTLASFRHSNVKRRQLDFNFKNELHLISLSHQIHR